MPTAIHRLPVLLLVLGTCVAARGQEPVVEGTSPDVVPAAEDATTETPPVADAPTPVEPSAAAEGGPSAEPVVEPAAEPEAEPATLTTGRAGEAIDEIASDVDRNANAQQVKAGILKPIYTLAEKFSFPAFHWVAFSAMVAGVVSFALQLVLGKLIVLSRMSLSISEILSDALGLAVSLIGLVLTTQAAAENSTFTTSAFSVLSATAVGALAGFVFYVWGQRQELQAAEGRRAAAVRGRNLPPSK